MAGGRTYGREVAQGEDAQETRLATGAIADDHQLSSITIRVSWPMKASSTGATTVMQYGVVPADNISAAAGVRHHGDDDACLLSREWETPDRRGLRSF